MPQPSWHCVANLGDADPLNHGGAFVLVDKRGNYASELIILECEGEDEYGDPTSWHRYTIMMEQCCLSLDGDGKRIVSDNVYHPNSPAWFGNHANLCQLASFIDTSVEDLARFFVGGLMNRAQAWLSVSEHWGPQDNEPDILSKREAARFCRTMLRQIKTAETWRDGWQ